MKIIKETENTENINEDIERTTEQEDYYIFLMYDIAEWAGFVNKLSNIPPQQTGGNSFKLPIPQNRSDPNFMFMGKQKKFSKKLQYLGEQIKKLKNGTPMLQKDTENLKRIVKFSQGNTELPQDVDKLLSIVHNLEETYTEKYSKGKTFCINICNEIIKILTANESNPIKNINELRQICDSIQENIKNLTDLSLITCSDEDTSGEELLDIENNKLISVTYKACLYAIGYFIVQESLELQYVEEDQFAQIFIKIPKKLSLSTSPKEAVYANISEKGSLLSIFANEHLLDNFIDSYDEEKIKNLNKTIDKDTSEVLSTIDEIQKRKEKGILTIDPQEIVDITSGTGENPEQVSATLNKAFACFLTKKRINSILANEKIGKELIDGAIQFDGTLLDITTEGQLKKGCPKGVLKIYDDKDVYDWWNSQNIPGKVGDSIAAVVTNKKIHLSTNRPFPEVDIVLVATGEVIGVVVPEGLDYNSNKNVVNTLHPTKSKKRRNSAITKEDIYKGSIETKDNGFIKIYYENDLDSPYINGNYTVCRLEFNTDKYSYIEDPADPQNQIQLYRKEKLSAGNSVRKKESRKKFHQPAIWAKPLTKQNIIHTVESRKSHDVDTEVPILDKDGNQIINKETGEILTVHEIKPAKKHEIEKVIKDNAEIDQNGVYTSKIQIGPTWQGNEARLYILPKDRDKLDDIKRILKNNKDKIVFSGRFVKGMEDYIIDCLDVVNTEGNGQGYVRINTNIDLGVPVYLPATTARAEDMEKLMSKLGITV